MGEAQFAQSQTSQGCQGCQEAIKQCEQVVNESMRVQTPDGAFEVQWCQRRVQAPSSACSERWPSRWTPAQPHGLWAIPCNWRGASSCRLTMRLISNWHCVKACLWQRWMLIDKARWCRSAAPWFEQKTGHQGRTLITDQGASLSLNCCADRKRLTAQARQMAYAVLAFAPIRGLPPHRGQDCVRTERFVLQPPRWASSRCFLLYTLLDSVNLPGSATPPAVRPAWLRLVPPACQPDPSSSRWSRTTGS